MSKRKSKQHREMVIGDLLDLTWRPQTYSQDTDGRFDGSIAGRWAHSMLPLLDWSTCRGLEASGSSSKGSGAVEICASPARPWHNVLISPEARGRPAWAPPGRRRKLSFRIERTASNPAPYAAVGSLYGVGEAHSRPHVAVSQGGGRAGPWTRQARRRGGVESAGVGGGGGRVVLQPQAREWSQESAEKLGFCEGATILPPVFPPVLRRLLSQLVPR